MEKVNHPLITRRAALLAAAAAAGCGIRKATGFPGYCFVANRGSQTVAAVDLSRFAVRKQIALDAAPALMAAHPDASVPKAYALALEAGTAYEIGAEGLEVTRRSHIGGQVVAMRPSAKGDAFWLLCREPSALVELRLDTMKTGRRIALPAAPDSFELGAGGRAVVGSRQGRSVSIVSLERGALERSIAVGSEPGPVQFREDGKQVMAGFAAEKTLVCFDAATGKTIVRLPLPLAPRHFRATNDGGQLFITGDGADAVVIVFPFLTEVDQTVLAGHAPGVMMITEGSPSYLVVANPESGSLTVLDVDTRKLVAVAQVGQGPCEIVMTPDRQYILALNEMSGDMAVLRMRAFAVGRTRPYRPAPLFTMIPVGSRPVSAAVVALRG
jgi:YVTN family beta-propeller protein